MKNYLRPEIINEIARKVGYCKRIRKLSPFDLVCLLISEPHRKDEVSLGDYTWELMNVKKIKISKEGLNKKFSELGVSFMKEVLNTSLKTLFNTGKTLCEGAIRIKDSTSFQCPMSMFLKFKGSGGNSSKAGIKIQFDFGIFNWGIYDLSIGEMAKPDIKDAMESNDSVNEGDIIIRDLGYIGVGALEKIKGNYLNRLHSCNIYESEEQEAKQLDFKTLYESLKKQGGKAIEKEIYITSKKFKTRLIASLVPEEVYAQRVRSHRKTAQRKGRTVSKNTLLRLRFNLYITNLSSEQLKAEEVRNIYRLRWQIELVFKAWKSYEHVGKLKEVKSERILMELYAKLIWILLKTRIERVLVDWGRDNGIPMSMMKIHKRLSKKAASVWDGLKSLIKMLLELVDDLPSSLRKDIKKDKNGVKYDCEKTLKKLEKTLTSSTF